MSDTVYKAVCVRLLQVNLTERINICCGCLEIVGKSGSSVDDEVLMSPPQGRYLESKKISNLMKFLFGESFSEVMYILKSVCKKCMISAITSYKFIQRCRKSAETLTTVVENIEDSLDGIPDDARNCKSLFISIEPNKVPAKAVIKRHFDKKRLFIPQDTALLRFQQILQSPNQPVKEINQINAETHSLICSKTDIDTNELLSDPGKPYEYRCIVCRKLFARSSSLRIHFFREHYKKNIQHSSNQNTQHKNTQVLDNLNVQQKNIQHSSNRNTQHKNTQVLDNLNVQQDEDNTFAEISSAKNMSYGENTNAQLIQDPLETYDQDYYDEDQPFEPTEFIVVRADEQSSSLETKKDADIKKLPPAKNIPAPIENTTVQDHKIKKHFTCKDCNMIFSSTIRYFSHKDEKNNCKRACRGRGKFICEQCNYVTCYSHLLKKHIRYKHLGEKAWVCNYCGKNCQSNSQLTTHIRKHTKEKPFICAVCGRKYGTDTGLKIHMTFHTGERPYSCKYCSKSFTNPSSRGRHMRRIHEAITPTLTCDLCGGTFKCRQQMIRHQKRHLNPRGHLSRKLRNA